MAKRIEKGQIVDAGAIIRVALDGGGEVSFDARWETELWKEGWRVIVAPNTTPPMIELDLSAIGLSAERALPEMIAAKFAELVAVGQLTDEQYTQFEMALAVHPMIAMGKPARQFRQLLTRMRTGDTLPLSTADPWAVAARTALPTTDHGEAWLALLDDAADGSRPTKKWNAMATKAVGMIGAAGFVETVQAWFSLVAPRPVVRDEENWFTPAMADENSAGLRNLVWACATITSERESEVLAVAIGNLAVRCFTKIPNVGALSTKAGNACIYVLSQLPGMRSVSQLSRLSARIRYTKALDLIEKAKLECAKRAGVEPIDLEELALPTFGLDVTGRARTELGTYTAEIAIAGDDATLAFFEGAKQLKSVPAALKIAHAEELKELKSAQKELAALVPTVRYRLERWLVEPRSWALIDLQARYLDHPLAARLARRLIYVAGATNVMFIDGYPIDVAGTQLELAPDTQLALWHPIGRPDAELDAWRALLASLEITQPIKQLEREIYAVDPSQLARRSSALFANRVVKQHRLAALCRERGWAYRLQGGFDSANAPTKSLPAYDLQVEVEIAGTGDETVSGAGIYLSVTIGDVTFYRGDQALALGEVPARCFSETLRDVDLFASV